MTSKEALLVAAERLIAERGVDVPLRDIAAAAGQRNNSAVHYHFGSRDNLISAVLDHRTAEQEQVRLRELARVEAAPSDDVRALVDIVVRPVCEMPYASGATHYARFMAQVYRHPALADTVFDQHRWPAVEIAVTRIYRLLDFLPRDVRIRRIAVLHTINVAFLADHERRTGGEAPPPDVIDDLVSMIVGMLTAPLLERV